MVTRPILSKRILVVVLATMLLIIAVGTVSAAFVSPINTADNAVDPAWSNATPNPYATDPAGDTFVTLDIIAAWVATNGPAETDSLYFRALFNSTNALGGSGQVGVDIDCNENGLVQDAGDRMVRYDRATDLVEIYDRTTDTVLVALSQFAGERTAGGSNIEWAVEKGTLRDAGGCAQAVDGVLTFQFASTAHSFSDPTDAGDGWSSPTSITLQTTDTGATQNSGTGLLVIVVSILATASVAALSFNRRSTDMPLG